MASIGGSFSTFEFRTFEFRVILVFLSRSQFFSKMIEVI